MWDRMDVLLIGWCYVYIHTYVCEEERPLSLADSYGIVCIKCILFQELES